MTTATPAQQFAEGIAKVLAAPWEWIRNSFDINSCGFIHCGVYMCLLGGALLFLLLKILGVFGPVFKRRSQLNQG